MNGEDAISVVFALSVGDSFVTNGKRWTISDYRGSTIGRDDKGEYARIKVWNEQGKETRMVVRSNSKVTDIQKKPKEFQGRV